jgi:hypothetical protein
MTLKFIIIQLLNILAWGLLIISYYRENKKQILFFHILATILYSLHYYFLGAYSGLYICIFEIVRDYMYFITDDDKDKYIFLCSLPVYGVLVAYMYKNLYDLFPIISCALAGWSLSKTRNVIIACAVIEYTLWVIYDITVKSYTGAFTDGTIVLANLILLIKKDFFKDDEKLNSLFNK